jgi:hypothetical protein
MERHEFWLGLFELLPEDILRHICSFIPLRDLFRVELVCKRLHRLCWPSLRSIDFTRFRYILSDLIINYVFSKVWSPCRSCLFHLAIVYNDSNKMLKSVMSRF